MHVVQINYAFDEAIADPDALLTRYGTLTGWSEALASAGAARVTVLQRFHRDASLARNGIDYLFARDGGGAHPRPWTWPRPLHRAAARARPDIVHVNGLMFPVQTWQLRHSVPASSAIVVQDHGGGARDHREMALASPLRQLARQRALRGADGFLFAAAAQADPWRRAELIAPHQSVYQVMEGSTAFRSMPRAEARRTSRVDGAPAVLWVGRLNANKDPLTILNGFELSLARLPGAVLTMIFSAEDLLPAVRERLRASSTLQTCVRLVGRVPHQAMAAFYSAADVFVLGSHHEGSGYALLEACACGVAPVVTDIPAFRVMTAGGSLGALWAPGDAHAFARALVKTCESDLIATRTRLADHFDRELSWPAIGRQAMAIYGEVVARRRAGLGC